MASTCQSQPPNSSYRLPSPLASVFLYPVSPFLLCKHGHLHHFSRFLICINIWYLFSLSHFILGDTLSVHSTSLPVTQFRSFLWPSNIPLYLCTITSLSIHLGLFVLTFSFYNYRSTGSFKDGIKRCHAPVSQDPPWLYSYRSRSNPGYWHRYNVWKNFCHFIPCVNFL